MESQALIPNDTNPASNDYENRNQFEIVPKKVMHQAMCMQKSTQCQDVAENGSHRGTEIEQRHTNDLW